VSSGEDEKPRHQKQDLLYVTALELKAVAGC